MLHSGELFPHSAASDPPQFPQAADHYDAEILAASQALRLHSQGDGVELIDAPWEKVVATCSNLENNAEVKAALLETFKISKTTLAPEVEHSLKPFVLLFDEYYTELYRMSLAESWMREAEHFVFMGTSFSVNITNIALRYALASDAKIEVVDPEPVDLGLKGITYHPMTAQAYVSRI